MAKVLFQFPPSGPRLTREEVRQLSDADLLQVIAFTDGLMHHRSLTDNEIENFWLVFDERRGRERSTSNDKSSDKSNESSPLPAVEER